MRRWLCWPGDTTSNSELRAVIEDETQLRKQTAQNRLTGSERLNETLCETIDTKNESQIKEATAKFWVMRFLGN